MSTVMKSPQNLRWLQRKSRDVAPAAEQLPGEPLLVAGHGEHLQQRPPLAPAPPAVAGDDPREVELLHQGERQVDDEGIFGHGAGYLVLLVVGCKVIGSAAPAASASTAVVRRE